MYILPCYGTRRNETCRSKLLNSVAGSFCISGLCTNSPARLVQFSQLLIRCSAITLTKQLLIFSLSTPDLLNFSIPSL